MEKPTQKQSRKRRVSEVAEEPNNDGPYSTFKGPTSDVVRAVHRGLSLLHPEVIERVRAQRSTAKKEDGGSCGSRKYVLDALVGTILSQNTTDVNSHRAFASLKEAFPVRVLVSIFRPLGYAAPAADMLCQPLTQNLTRIDTRVRRRGRRSARHPRPRSRRPSVRAASLRSRPDASTSSWRQCMPSAASSRWSTCAR